MIPFAHEGLVDLLEERQAPVKPAPDVQFGDRVSTGSDAESHPLNSVVFRRYLDEVEADAVAPRPPQLHPPDVHARRQRGLDREALPPCFGRVEPTNEFTSCRYGMGEAGVLHLDFVNVEE